MYQLSRPGKQRVWNQKNSEEFLRCCGVGTKIQKAVNVLAAEARRSGGNIDFSDLEKVGKLHIPGTFYLYLTFLTTCLPDNLPDKLTYI